MSTPDKRILRLIDVLIFQKTISSGAEFCESINIHRQTLTKVKNGTQGFTTKHIELICKIYKVNANWIFGIENKVFNTAGSIEITDLA